MFSICLKITLGILYSACGAVFCHEIHELAQINLCLLVKLAAGIGERLFKKLNLNSFSVGFVFYFEYQISNFKSDQLPHIGYFTGYGSRGCG